jgi:hypothetical protein
VAVSAMALSLASCTARTLPLPPPDLDPLVAPNAQGLVLVTGMCQEGAAVAVLNESTNTGVIVTSPMKNCDHSCRFEASIAAKSGDRLRIWQFYETTSTADLKVPK